MGYKTGQIFSQILHQIQPSLILEYFLEPFSLVLYSLKISQKNSFNVFGGACKI